MASWGDIGGKGTPLLGGRPGLELWSENKSFFIRLNVWVSRESARYTKSIKVRLGLVAGFAHKKWERERIVCFWLVVDLKDFSSTQTEANWTGKVEETN